MSNWIERIQNAVEKLHNCHAAHAESVPIHEGFRGRTVWEGVVELFAIENHLQAKRSYAWEVPGPSPDYVAVLEFPPVESPLTAVRVALLSQSRKV